MKKLILTALLSLFICAVFAQEQVIISDTTQVTLTKVYNDVTQGIQGLAQALKAPAEKVWEILVIQQKVNAITYTVLLTVGLIICIILLFTIKWLWKKAEDDCDYQDGAILMTILTIIAIIAEIVCTVNFVPDIITGFVNPEYGAIKEILNVIS